jgi:hypothetical protein
MRQIFGLLLLFSIVACGDRTQTIKTTTVNTAPRLTDTIKQQTLLAVNDQYGFDSTYELSKEHQPFLVTGHFNADFILDTAIIVRHKSTGKDALFIKHGGNNKSFLLTNGKDVGTDFGDFNWVGQFEVVKKGTKVWDNVIDGEIVGEEQVPDNRKITLPTDGIFVHVDEASGGGIIYYKNGKHVWVQQD